MPSPTGRERRSCQRHMSVDGLEFCLDHDAVEQIRIGATMNVSDTGMCVVSSTHLTEGECILIKNELPLASRKAVVRWSKNFQQNFCKAGLKFSE